MGEVDYDSLAAQPRMTASEIRRVWNAAARIDDSLEIRPRLITALAAKRIAPMPYSRSRLFERMLLCKPTLFSNFPIQRRRGQLAIPDASRLLEEIRSGLPQFKRARVRIRDAVEHLSISRVLDRWTQAKSVFGVTDLHYIGTRFDRRVDTGNLNDFNLLPRGTEGFQSQDSLVISSAGAVTDSHSDDHSGSNHCFTGTKLWLLWDTLEGFKHGLEDVERCDVHDRAAFDLPAFSVMSTSRWILIGPGQTMFIPAHLTHKVITLDRYLGLGSFHAGFPGFVDLLIRWKHLPPLWASRSAGDGHGSVEFITRRAIRRLRSLKKASRRERLRWGLPYLRARLQRPDINDGVVKREGMKGDLNLRAFLHAARQLM